MGIDQLHGYHRPDQEYKRLGDLSDTIQKVYVKVGDEVKAGDPLCVLVAMKMENEIRTPIDGVVKEVYVNETDKVSVGDKMLVVE